jgi:hypothetical protein
MPNSPNFLVLFNFMQNVILRLLLYFSNSNVPETSSFWLKAESRKTFHINGVMNFVCLKFRFRGAAAREPPLGAPLV